MPGADLLWLSACLCSKASTVSQRGSPSWSLKRLHACCCSEAGTDQGAASYAATLTPEGEGQAEASIFLKRRQPQRMQALTFQLTCALWVYNCTELPVAISQSAEPFIPLGHTDMQVRGLLCTDHLAVAPQNSPKVTASSDAAHCKRQQSAAGPTWLALSLQHLTPPCGLSVGALHS